MTEPVAQDDGRVEGATPRGRAEGAEVRPAPGRSLPVSLTKETRQRFIIPRMLDHLGAHLGLKAHHRVAIKITLAGAREIYANTHYETVESLICALRERFGVSDICVIEGSDAAGPGSRGTWEIFYKFRYKEVELNGASLVNLDERSHGRTLEIQTLNGPREVMVVEPEWDYLISLVPPKTHYLFPAVIGIPNLLGMVRPDQRHWVFGTSAGELRRLQHGPGDRADRLLHLASQNLAGLLKLCPINLSIVDGLYGMEGKGPVKGSPVFHGFCAASEDPVQVDALSAYLMGVEPRDMGYLQEAQNLGLGQMGWQRVLGAEPSVVRFPYRPHPIHQRRRNQLRQRNSPRQGQAGGPRKPRNQGSVQGA